MSIASAPNCNVGSWAQQWSCGWNANKTGAHVSYNPFTSHGGSMHVSAGVLVAAAIVVLFLLLVSRRRSGSAATR